QPSGALRIACLEDLDDAGKAVRDVRAGDAAGVERAHGQLRARLADRLRGDDADRVPDLAHLAGGEEGAVAGATDAELALALEHRPDRDLEVLRDLAELVGDLPQLRHRQLLALLDQDRLARPARGERLAHLELDDPTG